jgi:hypothetical protein
MALGGRVCWTFGLLDSYTDLTNVTTVCAGGKLISFCTETYPMANIYTLPFTINARRSAVETMTNVIADGNVGVVQIEQIVLSLSLDIDSVIMPFCAPPCV